MDDIRRIRRRISRKSRQRSPHRLSRWFTKGVIVMRFKEEGDQVISMALAEHEDTEEAEVSAEISANEENSTTET